MTNIRTRAASVAVAAVTVTAVTVTVAMLGVFQARAQGRLPFTPTCRVGDLYLAIGPAQGGAGSLFYPVEFTDTATHACALHGYPGVSVVDVGHRQLGPAAARNGASVSTVIVQPARVVTATIRTNNPGVVPTCRPTSTYVRVYPPASFASVLIPYKLRVCGSFEINPVQPTGS